MNHSIKGGTKSGEKVPVDDLDFKIPHKVKFDDEFSLSSEEADDRHTIRTVGSKTEFTNYSLTSSVIKRNEKLNDLDEHFENFFLKDIVEEQENPDSDKEDEDGKDDEILNSLVNEHRADRNKPDFHTDLPKDQILKIAERQLIEEENGAEELEEVELRLATGKNEHESRWDCESVLSNYSDIYNRPKMILEQKKSNKIKINMKTGMPEEGTKLTEKGLKEFNKQDDQATIRSTTSLISQLSIRNKDETKEEKQSRKKNLKEYMKERRQEKKANRMAFKEEHLRLNNEKVVNRQLTALKYN